MKESNTNMKDNNNNNEITWRRNKVQELSIKGFSQAEISRMLQISEPTISRDIEYLKQIANETIRNHIQNKLPYEYSKCISGLEEIIKESWIVVAHSEKIGNNKDKLQSLALIKDTYNTKMDLLTNASLLQDSIKFVSETKQNLSSKKENIDQSNNDVQGSAETNNDTEEQYNQVF
jgi:hypothetical protein